ncbi:MAG: LysR family transcriptional regulator [Alphaproteobacteria bacterium]
MDLRGVDLNLLVVLDALYENNSVTAAAKRLKVSQPTVSFSLAKLRLYFRDELFIRSAGIMQPTPFAQILRASVQEIMAIVYRDFVPRAHFAPEETVREFTLTTSDIGELCFLPLLIRAFVARAPRASLKCVSLPSSEIKSALLTGAIDAAAGYFPDLSSDEISSQHLFNHPFVCIARRDHPIACNDMSLEQFLNSSHAVVHHQGRSQEIAERTIEAQGLTRRVVLQSPHFVSLSLLIANTDLISIVPRSLATSFADLVGLQTIRPPFDIPDIPLRQHWAKRSATDPAVAWFVGLIEELFLDRDPTLVESASREEGAGQTGRSRG